MALGLPIAVVVDALKKAITSGFGWRIHPTTYLPSFHTGIDISFPLGTPIIASADGTVVGTGEDKISGKKVHVKYDGTYAAYAHLSKISVVPGQTIKQGQQIGTVGKTGRATGPHLHFSTFKVGGDKNWKVSANRSQLNPMNVLGIGPFVTARKVAIGAVLGFLAYGWWKRKKK